MNIDINLIPIFAIGVGLIITITAILSDTISKYKLKVEQIKADALVRVEEVRSRNQLELERLMHQEQQNGTAGTVNYSEPTQNYDDSTKLKSRVRE